MPITNTSIKHYANFLIKSSIKTNMLEHNNIFYSADISSVFQFYKTKTTYFFK